MSIILAIGDFFYWYVDYIDHVWGNPIFWGLFLPASIVWLCVLALSAKGCRGGYLD